MHAPSMPCKRLRLGSLANGDEDQDAICLDTAYETSANCSELLVYDTAADSETRTHDFWIDDEPNYNEEESRMEADEELGCDSVLLDEDSDVRIVENVQAEDIYEETMSSDLAYLYLDGIDQRGDDTVLVIDRDTSTTVGSFLQLLTDGLYYDGEIRYDVITPEFLTTVANCLRRLSQAQSLGAGAFVLRSLIELGTFYSQQELLYIRDQTIRLLQEEGFENPQVAHIIGFVYDWTEISPSSFEPVKSKKYRAVKYKNLIDVKEECCSICMDRFAPNSMCISTDCLHVFHSRCLCRWLRISPRCPFCRAMLKG